MSYRKNRSLWLPQTPPEGDNPPNGYFYEYVNSDGRKVLRDSNGVEKVFVDSDQLDDKADLSGTPTNIQSITKDNVFSGEGQYADPVPGLSLTVSPKSVTSQVLVIASVSFSYDDNGSSNRRGSVTLLRDSELIIDDRPILVPHSSNDTIEQAGLSILDTPATTNPVTYRVATSGTAVSGTVHINRYVNDATVQAKSTLTVMEVEP